MTPRAFIVTIAALFVVAAGVLLFTGVSATTSAGTQLKCGSVTSPAYVPGQLHSDPLPDGLGYGPFTTVTAVPKDCSDALSTREVWGYGILAIGAIGVLGGAVVRRPKTVTPETSATVE